LLALRSRRHPDSTLFPSTTLFRSSVSSKIILLHMVGSPYTDWLRKPLWFALPGSSTGGMLLALYTRPSTSGRSGHPPMKSTTTSSLIRGSCNPPKPPPAQGLDTRTQHELLSFFWP